jgi:hypothetical protein
LPPARHASRIRPDADFTATGILPYGCVLCQECGPALALHSWRPEWLELALNDADLQRLIVGWNGLLAQLKPQFWPSLNRNVADHRCAISGVGRYVIIAS